MISGLNHNRIELINSSDSANVVDYELKEFNVNNDKLVYLDLVINSIDNAKTKLTIILNRIEVSNDEYSETSYGGMFPMYTSESVIAFIVNIVENKLSVRQTIIPHVPQE